MGKLLEFKPKGYVEPKPEPAVGEGTEMVDPLNIRSLFSDDEVALIKDELDFMADMEDLGLSEDTIKEDD